MKKEILNNYINSKELELAYPDIPNLSGLYKVVGTDYLIDVHSKYVFMNTANGYSIIYSNLEDLPKYKTNRAKRAAIEKVQEIYLKLFN